MFQLLPIPHNSRNWKTLALLCGKGFLSERGCFWLFCLILSFEVLYGKSSQEYPVNAGVPLGSIHGPKLFQLYISDLPDDVICNIAIYVDNTTLYSKFYPASDLSQQLELASELESEIY